MRTVRAERDDGQDRLFIVAGERGAVEMRVHPNFSYFTVHSPVWREDLADRAVSASGRRGRGSLPGLALHGCHVLEGECWTGLISCGSYDFDRPDADTVIQWEALEELYETYLGGRS